MRERIESKHVTKEIKSQMPVISPEIIKERGCTFCPYYLGSYEKQPRCMMKNCAWDDENERFHPILRRLIPFYKEKMEKAEEKFLAVKQIYTTLLKMFADEMKQEEFLYTKMRNVAGIAQNEAQKSADMFNKCQYLDEITGGKGITFATGTPISNSMTELYVMQRYLQNSKLQNMGLGLFDSWASTFGEVVTSIEFAQVL